MSSKQSFLVKSSDAEFPNKYRNMDELAMHNMPLQKDFQILSKEILYNMQIVGKLKDDYIFSFGGNEISLLIPYEEAPYNIRHKPSIYEQIEKLRPYGSVHLAFSTNKKILVIGLMSKENFQKFSNHRTQTKMASAEDNLIKSCIRKLGSWWYSSDQSYNKL